MKPLIPLLAVLLLAGCSLPVREARPDRDVAKEAGEQQAPPAAAQAERTETAKPADQADGADEDNASLPAVALTPKLLYQFLVAEIAAQRGQLGQAAELYLDLAYSTRDPRVARRATEMSLHGRRMDIALQAAQLWVDCEPTSSPARQTQIGLLAAQGRYAELKAAVAALLAAEPMQLGPNLVRLNRLFARGGDRKAIRDLIDQVTEPYVDLPEAFYARALAAYEARDVDGARLAILRALALKPDWEAAALLRVQMIENRTEAIAELGSFVAAHPHAREARLAYARALVGDKRYVEARRQFAALLEDGGLARNGDVVFAVAVLSLQLNDTAEAERYLRQLVDIGHAETAKARYFLGQIAEEGKRWDEALQWFDQVGHGEHYLNARLHAANVLAKQGKLAEARRHLTDTDASSPQERVQLLIGEAQILRETGSLAEARAVLVAGLERLPDQPDLLYDLALLEEKMGQFDTFETRLRRLLELRPDHAHALNALGYALAERNVRLPEARELIERALELRPDDPFILDSQGWVLFRQGDAAAALEVLKTAFSLRADPETAAHIGEVLWALGRQDEARATWEKARKESPNNEALLETIKRFQP
jgi:tetratricopeptide (TPR) repeat protein